jgi:peroxiredoxin
MKRYLSLALLIILLTTNGFGQTADPITAINVKDLKGKTMTLARFSGQPLMIVFLGVECPVSQKYIARLKALKNTFKDQVIFVGVFPSGNSQQEVAKFKETYDVNFPLVIDADNKMVNALRATITPEVFALTKERRLVYSGAIDNWFYDLGKYRSETTQYYLSEAIESILKGEVPVTQKTEAIGCIIQSSNNHKSHSHH